VFGIPGTSIDQTQFPTTAVSTGESSTYRNEGDQGLIAASYLPADFGSTLL
jgi:hypothetical protein